MATTMAQTLLDALHDGRNSGYPLVFGHRGGAAVALENTLAAFGRARTDNVPAVEVDVQLSSDDRIVVFHDRDLKRLAGVPDKIAALPFRDLSTITLTGPPLGRDGTIDNDNDHFTEVGIPLLSEVIETLPSTTYIDIEIKPYNETPAWIVTALAELIHHYGIADRVMVSSFDPRRIWRFRAAAAKTLPRGVRVACANIYARHSELPCFLRGGAGRFIGGGRIGKPSAPDITGAHPLPQLTVPWTVNDCSEAVMLRNLGAAGIIGDNPVALMKALMNRPDTGQAGTLRSDQGS